MNSRDQPRDNSTCKVTKWSQDSGFKETIFQNFYSRKKGEGGGQKVMIGIIISEDVDNYGRYLKW